ncbi:hypothetical protein Oant_1546 [Brucella anthropi ATCC 49188]|uniref:Uncharacterized protein n=1 Tax=Brucella anthropi (strain ATCC 49188 / DSM 6882 / CCUG 24695 / JCM 21032 / LMG 3331 / NBRC 15819 / NCTC 12168 / Alc 37) TaxID=439375 RepID=A6WZ58_BRUA4|nr:hypothetical protein Oant_1546 [Brucella anthropi ATCC 49188]SUA65412.1 Uncharacterised protein [Brucella anthropi]
MSDQRYGYFRSERPDALKKITRQIILMPRWGSKTIIVKEQAILLPRVSILESDGGFGEDNGPSPSFQGSGRNEPSNS